MTPPPATTPPTDQAAAETALDPMRFAFRDTQLIEASAGTGKTFTLALLYVRLVLGHGDEAAFSRPLTPPEILVVTFTKAATQELRERIRKRLVEAADHFEVDPSAPERGADDPHLCRLRQAYPAAQWPGCAQRLRLAAEWMDEAVIATIHGWCQRMLQEHAFETRGLFHRELTTDQTDLVAEVLRDYWRIHCYPLPTEQARSLTEVVPSPDHLEEKLAQWLAQRDRALSFQGRPIDSPQLSAALERQTTLRARREHAAHCEEEARHHWLADWQTLAETLWALRPHLNGTRHGSANEERFTQLLTEIRQWAEGGQAPSKLPAFGQHAFQFKAKAKVQQPPEHPAFAAVSRWQEAVAACPESDSTAPSVEACILAHATQWIRRELPRRLHQRAEMGFDDLLTELDRALDPTVAGPQATQLAATLRRQFPVALIDEFQDTDLVQYRLFDRVYGEAWRDEQPATALILIGDPKQSIYGFRGADIHSYLAARRATQGRHHTLTTNFRSTAPMVAACNHLFAHADRHDRGAFRFRTTSGATSDDPIPYRPVEASGTAKTSLILDGQPASPMTFWRLEADDEPVGVERYRAEMAAATASQVVRWLHQAQRGEAGFRAGAQLTPLQPRDLAILVRTGKEAELIRSALAARQVPSVYLSERESVFCSPEAHDLVHWLQACAHPSDERLVRTALGTNTLAVPLHAIANWQEDELAWERQLERFHRYRRLWHSQGVLAMLRRLMHDFELPGHCLARERGERRLTNLLHLAEWLQQSARALDGEQALIRHLQEHLDGVDEEFVVRLESDAELVKVITIHKSKGLEYPLVLLPFACDWKEIDGRVSQVPYRCDHSRYLELDKGFKAAWQAADDERLSEDLRLLYVALTRACHGVWLGITPLKRGTAKRPQLERSAIGYVLGGGHSFAGANAVWEALDALCAGTPHLRIAPVPATDDTPFTAASTYTPEAARPAPQIRHTPWWIASYSALRLGPSAPSREAAETAADDTAREEAPPADAPPVAPTLPGRGDAPGGLLHLLPRGPQIGNFLHGIFEGAAALVGDGVRGFAAAAHDDSARRDLLARRCQLRNLTDWIDPLDRWLADYLTRSWPLPTPTAGAPARVRLADLAPEQMQTEMEFWFPAHRVDTAALDAVARAHCLPGQERPRVATPRLNGMLKGYIDLVFEHHGRYYVLDWKSNWLGADDSAYDPARMGAAILSHRYDLQYLIYLLALHRQLQARLPGYDPEHHLGGAVYAFLRGGQAPSGGLYTDRPPVAVITALDRLFSGTAAGSGHHSERSNGHHDADHDRPNEEGR